MLSAVIETTPHLIVRPMAETQAGLFSAIGEWRGSDRPRPCHHVTHDEYVTAVDTHVVCVRGRWCVRIALDSRLAAADLAKTIKTNEQLNAV